MSEHDNQVSFFHFLELNKGQFPYLAFIFAIPNGGARHPAVAGRLKAEGVKRGVPDICIPIARHGHGGAWIENKFGDNRMTPEQVKFRDFLLTQNYAFKTAYTLDQALDFTDWYLGIFLKRA